MLSKRSASRNTVQNSKLERDVACKELTGNFFWRTAVRVPTSSSYHLTFQNPVKLEKLVLLRPCGRQQDPIKQ